MGRALRLIAGLGNPGARYERTRHNAGFWFVDTVARAHHAPWRHEARFFGDVAEVSTPDGAVRLLKPTTQMNASGRALGAMMRYYGLALDELLVAHDEIDLPPGVVRIKRGGGHGGHNGLRDVIPQLGGADFVRLRIGVGHPGSKEQVVGYVLSRASARERALIEAAIARAGERFDDIAAGRIDRVMNELHRRDEVCDVVELAPPARGDRTR